MRIPFAKIESFTADPDDNIMLANVWLDVEGKRLLATDGHMASRVTIEVEPTDVTGLVPVEAFELARKELKALSKALGKDTIPDPMLRVIAGEDAVIVENLLTTTSHIVKRPKLIGDQKFPSVDGVFKPITHKPSVSVAVAYLADILKALDGDGASLWITSDDACVTIASAAGQAICVLMPRKEEVNVEEVNRRGQPATSRSKDDLTVSVSVQNEQGQMEEIIPPMPAAEFTALCDQVEPPSEYYKLRTYLKAHMDDDPLRFPEEADPDECSRILEELRAEVIQ